MEIQVALITGGTAVVAAVIGWFAQIAVASLKGDGGKGSYSGAERREQCQALVRAELSRHAETCHGLTMVATQLELLRKEIVELRAENREHMRDHSKIYTGG